MIPCLYNSVDYAKHVCVDNNQNFTIDCSLNGWLFTFSSWFPLGPIYLGAKTERIFSTFFQLKMSEILLTNHHMTFGMTRWSQAEMEGKKSKGMYTKSSDVSNPNFRQIIAGGRKPRVNRSQAYTWVNFVTVTLTNRQFRDFRIIPSSSKIHNFTYLGM